MAKRAAMADFDRHDEIFAWVEGNPVFNNLHDESAYRELVARLGFQEQK